MLLSAPALSKDCSVFLQPVHMSSDMLHLQTSDMQRCLSLSFREQRVLPDGLSSGTKSPGTQSSAHSRVFVNLPALESLNHHLVVFYIFVFQLSQPSDLTVRKPNIPAARIKYKLNDELTLDTAKSEKRQKQKRLFHIYQNLSF